MQNQIKTKLIFSFFFLYLLDPTLYVAFFLSLTGLDVFIEVFKTVSVLILVIVGFSSFLFLLETNKLEKILNSIKSSGNDKEKNKDDLKYINYYPTRISLYLTLGNIIGPIAFNLILYFTTNVYNSLIQFFYFITIGFVMAFVAGIMQYLYSKKLIHKCIAGHGIKVLTFFEAITLPVISTISILLTIMLIALYIRITNIHYESIETITRQTTLASSSRVQAFLEVALDEARALSKVYYSAIVNKDFYLSRENSIKMLKSFMDKSQNKNFLGVWVIFEPDQFDGQDSYYRNTAGHDTTGRHLGYWVKNSRDELVFEKPIDYEKAESEFYQIPKKTKTESIIDPFSYPVDGKNILMTSLVVPILDKNEKFLGVVGVDIDIDELSTIINTIPVYGGGYLTLLSEKRTIISTLKKELIGKNILDLYKDNPEIYEKLKSRGEYYFSNISKISGQKIYNRGVSILIGNTNSEWKSTVSIPVNNLQKPLDFLTWVFIFAEVSGIILVIVISYLTINPLTGSINEFIHNFSQLKEGNLSVHCDEVKAMSSELVELSSNFNSLMNRLKGVISTARNSSENINQKIKLFSTASKELSSTANSQAASIHQVSDSLDQMTLASDAIANNAKMQSELFNDTYKTLDELKGKIHSVAENTKQALTINNNARDIAGKGNELMKNAIGGMDKIDESTGKIAEIVTMITDISDQVNLLSLNASIEAARAGEHGRGFAIVAQEIGKLAERTASNANLISGLVKNGLFEVKKGKEYVDNTSKALKEIIDIIEKSGVYVKTIAEDSRLQESYGNAIVEHSKKIKEMAESIASSTKEQRDTNKELKNSINSIATVTRTVATNSSQILDSVKEISDNTEAMNEQMGFFKT